MAQAARGLGRPVKSPEAWRDEFVTRFGQGSDARFIRRCREGTFREAAASFGMKDPARAWQWYCRLTGEKRKPRPAREEPTAELRPRGRPRGSFERPDVTFKRIKALVARGLAKTRIARQLRVSRPTIYKRLGAG